MRLRGQEQPEVLVRLQHVYLLLQRGQPCRRAIKNKHWTEIGACFTFSVNIYLSVSYFKSNDQNPPFRPREGAQLKRP